MYIKNCILASLLSKLLFAYYEYSLTQKKFQTTCISDNSQPVYSSSLRTFVK